MSWPISTETAKRVTSVDSDGNSINFSNRLPIELNPAFIDPFSRLRIAEAVSVFDAKNVYVQDVQFGSVLAGGGTATFNYNKSVVELTVGTASGDSVLVRSHRHMVYSPGKGVEAFITGSFNTKKANLLQKIGFLNDGEGLYFSVDATGIAVNMVSAVTGSTVTTTVYQTAWNVDKLDGTGRSGKTLVYDKANIFFISYQWLGVGRVVFGFDIDGELQVCHEFLHAGIVSGPYVRDPSFAVGYSIANTGVTASGSTLTQICASVNSSALSGQTTVPFTASNNTTAVACNTGGALVLAIRPKLVFPASPGTIINRYTAEIVDLQVYATSQPIYWEIRLYPFPSVMGGSYSSVGTTSSVEYSVNPTFTGSYTVIFAGYTPSGSGANRAVSNLGLDSNDRLRLTTNSAGTSPYVLALFAKSFSGTADVCGAFRWLEYS